MRSITVLFISIFFIGTFTSRGNAQAAIMVLLFGDKVASENFYFSLKLGANISNLSGLDEGNYKAGFNFGLLATIKFSEKFYLVPEFSALSRKGVNDIKYIPSGIPELDYLIGTPEESKMILNYIDIPVIAKYQIDKKFNIGTGPQLSILTSGKNVYVKSVYQEDNISYSQQSKLTLNDLDFGWAFELTYNLWEARGGKGMNIHARYTLGISDIIKDNTGDPVRNSVFQISASFPFIE
jgi:hypothetical protein